MQATSLSQQQLTAVIAALDMYVRDKGSREILGAQLGTLVSEATHPQSLRSLGGLRAIVERDLRAFVQAEAKDPVSKDIVFSIRRMDAAQGRLPLVPAQPREVTGPELWRYFSNPRLACELFVNSLSGVILVGEPGALVANEVYKAIGKPSPEEYRSLAHDFAENQVEPIKSNLGKIFEIQDYYNDWIDALRRMRSYDPSLLRNWETVRTEYVAKRLSDSLTSCGMHVAKISEVVASARPPVRFRTVQKSPHVQVERTSPPAPLVATAGAYTRERGSQTSQWDDASSLRMLIHQAVDLMSPSELRDIRIPAGLLHDVARQIPR